MPTSSPLLAADALQQQLDRMRGGDDPPAGGDGAVAPAPVYDAGLGQLPDDRLPPELQQVQAPGVPSMPRIDLSGRSAPEYDEGRAQLMQALGALAAAGTAAFTGRSPTTSAIAQGLLEGTAQSKRQMDEQFALEQEAFNEWLREAQGYNRQARAQEAQMQYNAETDQYEYRRGRRDDLLDDRREQRQDLQELERREELERGTLEQREELRRETMERERELEREMPTFDEITRRNRERRLEEQQAEGGEDGEELPSPQALRREIGRRQAEMQALQQEIQDAQGSAGEFEEVDQSYIRSLKRDLAQLRREEAALQYDLQAQTGGDQQREAPSDMARMGGPAVQPQDVQVQDLRQYAEPMRQRLQQEGQQGAAAYVLGLLDQGQISREQANALLEQAGI